MIGDVGFDPLRLAEVQVDLSYARGAEIKHGRIAMLVRRPVLSNERPNESLLYQATVGFLVQEYVHLPGEAYQNSQPYTCPESWNHSSYLCLITLIVIPRLKAPWTVPWAANLQILLLAGCVELATADTTYGDTPWDLGFDPLCFQEGKSQAELDDLALKELTNGRLAMMAFVGMTIQTLLFDKPLLSFS